MTLQEAIKSGKRFRRRGALGWNAATPPQTAAPNQQIPVYSLLGREILADDWEVEEKQVTITESHFESAISRAFSRYNPPHICEYLIQLKKELGL